VQIANSEHYFEFRNSVTAEDRKEEKKNKVPKSAGKI